MNFRLNPIHMALTILFAAVLTSGCTFSGGSTADDSPDQTAPENTGEKDGAVGEAESDGSASGVEAKGDEDEKKEEAVPVEIARLERGPIETVLKSSATLEAEMRITVFAEASRRVRELLVEEGDTVRKGQMLLRLQDDQQRNNLTKVNTELAKAEREYERQNRLFKEQMISEQVFNEATNEIQQLRLSLEDAERELSYTAVKAPVSGTITQRWVNLGDQVTAGQQLFEIIDFNSIVAWIYVPEKNLVQLRPGLPARVSTPASTEQDYQATVKRVAPTVDPTSGTVKVTVGIGGQRGLRPGMYVDVELVTETRPDAVLVPKRALVYDNDSIFVYRLVAESRVERVLVRPRMSNKEFVEPHDSLEEGDRIVIAGQAGLKDGSLIELPGGKGDSSDAPAGTAGAVARKDDEQATR